MRTGMVGQDIKTKTDEDEDESDGEGVNLSTTCAAHRRPAPREYASRPLCGYSQDQRWRIIASAQSLGGRASLTGLA